MARDEEIDWGELVTLGSLVGNLLQAQRNQAAHGEIKQREGQVLQLLQNQDALLASIRRFEHGVSQLEQKIRALETLNSNLLKENEKLEGEKSDLLKQIAELEKGSRKEGV